jgi:uncharacterized protein YjbI with pentapeptide repeats
MHCYALSAILSLSILQRREQAMGARFRSWWQQIKKHRVAIVVTTAIIVVAVVLIIVGYWFDWSGFNGYIQVSTIHTISGPTAGTVTRTEAYQPDKTLWDWLQLLIIPVVLVIAGYVINLTISRGEQEATKQRALSEREAAEKRAETEREVAIDNQREAALQEYIDRIAELLLEKKLRESKSEEDEVRKIARIRTLTTLARLDKKRKKDVLQFLNESGLIERDTPFIRLYGANLSEANLSGVNLSGANLVDVDLSGANLSRAQLGYIPFPPEDEQEDIKGANLSRANLTGADLSRADLEEVKLRNANLTKANLSGANLERADLWRANLTEAVLSFAKLTDAGLSFANLTGADLTNAELNSYQYDNESYDKERGPDLRNAKLNGVTGISIEELEQQACSLKGATMPDGTKHD